VGLNRSVCFCVCGLVWIESVYVCLCVCVNRCVSVCVYLCAYIRVYVSEAKRARGSGVRVRETKGLCERVFRRAVQSVLKRM
jgi:hypothetical protein